MKRRNFLALSITGVAAIGASYWYFMYSDEGYYNSLHYPEVLASIYDTETIIEIGMEYRQQFSNEDNEEQLKQMISMKTSDKMNNRKALGASIKKDFDANNIVMLNGWMLSVTEARQCALFSIINSK